MGLEIKAPLGIMPFNIWLEQRKLELIAAIERYVSAGFDVPYAWIIELNCLHGIGD